ncbi:MAG: signal recognition particle protein [Bacteroidetes bacterium]|nr:MAG: signal recognition particle protein [Bacteroidota bacterium]
MFENLSVNIERALKNLKGQGRITEINVAETLKEVRRALLDADVNYRVAKEFTDRVKEEALGQKILIAVSPGQMLVKIVYDELTKLMGGVSQGLRQASNPPTIILISGLQGSGKTTFCGKLAKSYKSKGKNPLMIAGDVYRPAAINQLSVLGEQIGVEVYKEEGSKNPVEIALNGIRYAKQKGKDFVIVDTAGRLAIDEEMMIEIQAVKAAVAPTETLFVVDAMTGQDAVNTAKTFNERLNFDGVVLTKMDGDTRGGAAISILSVADKPIKFISTGEKLEDLDLFYPDRMASRILGMGDVLTLVERAQAQFNQEESERLQKKLRKNELDLEDFLSQLQMVKKMGNIKDLLGFIPGMGKMLKDVDVDEKAFKHLEAIIQSMTAQERRKPEVIDGSRRKRIAAGSGRTVREVNELLNQFTDLKKAVKKMNQNAPGGKLPRGMAGGLPMRRR